MQRAWLSAPVALGVFFTAGLLPACANSGGGSCEGESPNPTYQCCETGSGPAWIDIFNDSRNCGGCGSTCAAGAICRAGHCEGGTGDGGMMMTGDGGGGGGMCTPACSSSQRCCGTSCISRSGVAVGSDGRSDPTFLNCTACGIACDAERATACSVPGGGTGTPRCMCGVYDQCVSGQVCALSGTEYRCVSTSTDPMNCGSIGHACGSNEDCVAGTCTPRMCGSTVCTATQACCGATCIDTQSDAANCGGCGMACGTGESCQAGACVCGSGAGARVCTAPSAGNLGESCCDGSCVANSDTNCGCGTACDTANDETCQFGMSLLGGGGGICCGGPEVAILGCGGLGGLDGGFPFP